MGPWSSWLTPFEAKRRFPHAEEIAGSNPDGPTTNSIPVQRFSLFSSQSHPARFFRIYESMLPNHRPGSGDGVTPESGYNMNMKMHHHLTCSLPIKLNDTYSVCANSFLHSNADSLNHTAISASVFSGTS